MAQRMLRGQGGGSGSIDPGLMAEAREAKRESDAAIRERDARLDYRAKLMTGSYELQQRQAREESAKLVDRNGARSLLDTSGRFAGHSGEMPWGAASKINPYTGGRLGDTEELVKPTEKMPWYKTKLSHLALRSFAATLVVESVADALNNEENYKKAIRLAGGDSGAQSEAVMGRMRGAFQSVPLIGGMAYNLGNGLIGAFGGPSEQSIQTQNALTQQQVAFQNSDTGIRLGAISSRLGAQAMLAGNSLYGRSIQSRIGKIGRDAGVRAMGDDLLSRAGVEGYAQDWSDLSTSETGYMSWIPFAGAFFRNGDVDNANDARVKRNDQRRAQVNNVLSAQRAANKAIDAAEEQERMFQYSFSRDLQRSQITQGDYNTEGRTIGGIAARATLDYQAHVADARRRGMNPEDRELLQNEGIITTQDLLAKQRDITEELRWGSGRQSNPFVESPLAYTDRSMETPAEKMEALTKAVLGLEATIKGLNSQGNH
jgi:hypothetical protein